TVNSVVGCPHFSHFGGSVEDLGTSATRAAPLDTRRSWCLTYWQTKSSGEMWKKSGRGRYVGRRLTSASLFASSRPRTWGGRTYCHGVPESGEQPLWAASALGSRGI